MIVQTTLHAQKEKNLWIIDNGCLSHMTGDKSKFMNFKNFDGGFVTLGNNYVSNITGKGTLSLDGGKTKTHDALCVEGLKHNILSVIQMCDKGCDILVSAKGCEIDKSGTRELIVEEAGQTVIYHLSELNSPPLSDLKTLIVLPISFSTNALNLIFLLEK